MAQFGECPFGFEDGHVLRYEAKPDHLVVEYEFWNEKRGLFTFDGFVAAHDDGALGVTIGSTEQKARSEFLTSVVRRLYEKPPNEVDLTHYLFLDVDDHPVLGVVAKACSFSQGGPSERTH